MTGPARSSDKLTMGSILKSLLHTSLSMLVLVCACTCLFLCLSVLVLVCSCTCLCLWCLMPWNITKRRCPLSYSSSDESKSWWIVVAMYLCAFLFSFLMLFNPEKTLCSMFTGYNCKRVQKRGQYSEPSQSVSLWDVFMWSEPVLPCYLSRRVH